MKRLHRHLIWAACTMFGLHTGALSAQVCNVDVSAVQNPLCKGENAIFIATGAIQNVGSYSFDFNTGTMPPGWSFTGQAQFTAPCSPSPTTPHIIGQLPHPGRP